MKRLVLALASFLLTLVALELAVRLSSVDPEPGRAMRFHPLLGWTMDPSWSGLII